MGFTLTNCNVLILSDLHLSEGIHAGTRKYSTKEDFFFDREFGRFLKYHQERSLETGSPWHLIINGDMLDFLQVTSSQDAPVELRRGRHLRYGLDCGEPQSVYKFHKIADGHREFFHALARFVAMGNVVTVIKGNHDVEFHYSAVRETLIAELRNAYDCGLEGPATRLRDAINADSVRFADWFYYEPRTLWIEHGNQYDEVNVLPYNLSPLMPEGKHWPTERRAEIDLPWGSLFVRYLFNDIEQIEPFADNIKPQTEFIRWIFRRHPLMGLRFAICNTQFLFQKLRRAWTPARPAAYTQRRQEHEERLRTLASESGIAEEDLRYVDGLRARSLLKETSPTGWKVARVLLRWRILRPLLVLMTALGGLAIVVEMSPLFEAVIPGSVRYLLWERWNTGHRGVILGEILSVIRWFVFPVAIAVNAALLSWLLGRRRGREVNTLELAARKIIARLGVKAVLMGHTHDADLRCIDEGGEYINTGTWTRVFSEEERLIRDDLEFVFVQGLRKEDGLQLQLMRWDDATQEPRLLKLFEEDDARKRKRRPIRPT